jgi:hypothetical protein
MIPNKEKCRRKSGVNFFKEWLKIKLSLKMISTRVINKNLKYFEIS